MNENDSVSRRFLDQALRPLFLREERKCLTSFDFVPGVCYQDNLDNALLFSNIVIIVVTSHLTRDRRVRRNITAVISDDISCDSCRVIPILIEHNDELPTQLKSITGIPYDSSQPDCNDLLAKGLEKAFLFQEVHKWGSVENSSYIAPAETSGSYHGSERTPREEVQLSHSSAEVPRSLEISDSAADEQLTQQEIARVSQTAVKEHIHVQKIHEPNESAKEGPQKISTTPRNPVSHSPRPYQLEIFGVFRSSWCYAMRRALMMKPGNFYDILRILSLALILILCLPAHAADHVSSSTPVNPLHTFISRLLRALAMIIAAAGLRQYLGNFQRVCSDERLEFGEERVTRIGKHLIGENQMDADVQDPDEMFDHLRRFLGSVALVNFITAWLYPITITVLLWQLGYYDRKIYQGSTWVAYINILQDVVVLNLMQGFLRTLIGIHHYERTLLVEAHKMEQESESDEQIRSAAILLRERTNNRNRNALGVCFVIALVSIAAACYNGNYAGRSLSEVRNPYACLIIWLFVLEALINCPKRHMKVTAVAINSLAIGALLLLKWNGNWKVQDYPDFEKSLTRFLPFIELRMLCLMSTFHLLLDGITLLQTNNWPLPSLRMRDNCMKRAITLPLVVLLVGSAILG